MLVNHPALSPTIGKTTHMPAPEIMPLSSPETVVVEVMLDPEW